MQEFRLVGLEFNIMADFNTEQVRCFNKVSQETNKMLDRLEHDADIKFDGTFPVFLPSSVDQYEINVHNYVANRIRMILLDSLDDLPEEIEDMIVNNNRVCGLELV